MRQQYSHILTLLFRHQYFRDNLFKSIQISYSESTAKLIQDLNIILKPFVGGIHVLVSNPDLLNRSNDADPIRLYINCEDPFYINYTELSTYNPTDTVLWFNNLDLTVNSDPENKDLKLHKEGFVSENEIIKLSSNTISIDKFQTDKEYNFTDVFKNEISTEFLSQSKSFSNHFVPSNLPEGIIYLFQEKQEIEKIYYYPKTIEKNPLGIVDLCTTTLLKQYKEQGKLNYTIAFNSKETIWKYFFVNPIYQKFDKLSIIDKGKEQLFSSPQKQYVHGNTEALVFESNNKLPLSEFSKNNFQLVDNYDKELRSGKVIIKNLAKPSPEQLYSDETKPNELVYSHIYI